MIFQQVEEKKASHNSQIPGEGVQVDIALGQSLEIEEPEHDMTFSRKVQLMFADYSKGVKSPSDKNYNDYPNPKDAVLWIWKHLVLGIELLDPTSQVVRVTRA